MVGLKQLHEKFEALRTDRIGLREAERPDVIVVSRHIVMVAVMLMPPPPFFTGFIGLGREPGLDIGGLLPRIEQPHGEQPLGRGLVLMGGQKPCRWIERPQPRDDGEQRILTLAAHEQVDLGQHNAVGHRHLLDRFRMSIERRHSIECVDHGDDAFEAAGGKQIRIAHHRVEHGCRIGEARRFDDDAVEGLDVATPPSGQQIVHRINQVAANGAAKTARGHLDDVLVGAFHQQVVDTHVTELVDDHRRVGQERILQQGVQQRCLSSAEETGQDGDGNGNSVHGVSVFLDPIRLAVTVAAKTKPPPTSDYFRRFFFFLGLPVSEPWAPAGSILFSGSAVRAAI